MSPTRQLATAALAGALALGLAACGSSSSSISGGSGIAVAKGVQTPRTEAQSGGKRGGTLTVLNHTDFEQLDPGLAYYNIDYEVVYATQRPLFSYKPNTFSEPTPDMASEPAKISGDGKTITVHIRKGVHFSPPVNREVTSADVAYAIERGANPNVGNPYFEAYFKSLVGFKQGKRWSLPGHHDAEPIDDRLPPDRTEGADRARRAGAAAERARAGGIRQALRRDETDRIRQLPGRDGPVHAQERQRREGARHRLRTGQIGDARAQPELESRDRLPARLPEPDRHQARRRHDRDRPPGAGRLGHGPERNARAADRAARV